MTQNLIKTLITMLLIAAVLSACATLPPADPKRSATLHEEALRMASIKNYTQSIDKFNEAIRYNPQSSQLYQQQAEVLEMLQQFPEASRTYKLALDRIAPDDIDREQIHYRLGLLLARDQGKQRKARQHLEKLTDPSQQADLEGMMTLSAGDPDTALRLFNQALKSAPDFDAQARIYYHASLAHYAKGDIFESKNALFNAVNKASSLALKQHITIFFDQIR